LGREKASRARRNCRKKYGAVGLNGPRNKVRYQSMSKKPTGGRNRKSRRRGVGLAGPQSFTYPCNLPAKTSEGAGSGRETSNRKKKKTKKCPGYLPGSRLKRREIEKKGL